MIPLSSGIKRRPTMTVKALGYLRVSGKGQVDGDGFERQLDTITKYAKSHGLEIAGVYRDEGVSGTKDVTDRPGLSDLIEHVASNGVRMVLVERADRLARDLIVGELILSEFRKLGVNVIAADGGTDLTADSDEDPTKTLIRQVLGAVAQFEKTVIVLKLRGARDRMRRREGRCEGRKPFGTKPGEADVLDRIRRLHRKPRGGERLSAPDIADTLNSEQVPTRTGRPWNRGTVWALLKRA
jgi:DNA invertase Pin-like site-specific DNA recombinase